MSNTSLMPEGTDLTKSLADALADAASQKARADQAEKDRDAQRARADQAEKDRDAAVTEKNAAELAKREAEKDAKAAQGRIDAAEEKAKQSEKDAQARLDAAFDARVSQRVEVLKNAETVLGSNDENGKPVDRSKVSDLDLMKQIAQRVDGEDAVLESDSEDAVRVAYRGALKRHAAATESRANVRTAVQTARRDGAKTAQKRTAVQTAEREALNRMNQDMSGGWSRKR